MLVERLDNTASACSAGPLGLVAEPPTVADGTVEPTARAALLSWVLIETKFINMISAKERKRDVKSNKHTS